MKFPYEQVRHIGTGNSLDKLQPQKAGGGFRQLPEPTDLRISFRKLAHTLITNDYTIIDVKSKVEPKSILIWTNKLRDFKKLKN